MGINNSLRMAMAKTAMIPPMVRLPVSPMNTCAGKELPKESDGGTINARKHQHLTCSGDIHDI